MTQIAYMGAKARAGSMVVYGVRKMPDEIPKLKNIHTSFQLFLPLFGSVTTPFLFNFSNDIPVATRRFALQ
jgi:hypothetical protein